MPGPISSPPLESTHEKSLHLLVMGEDVEKIKECVRNGANPNQKGYQDFTPLHTSVALRLKKVTKCLLEECHASIDTVNKYGDTPLHLAVWNGDLGHVKYLVKIGKANQGARNTHNETPVDLALTVRHSEVVKWLTRHQSKKRKRTEEGDFDNQHRKNRIKSFINKEQQLLS